MEGKSSGSCRRSPAGRGVSLRREASRVGQNTTRPLHVWDGGASPVSRYRPADCSASFAPLNPHRIRRPDLSAGFPALRRPGLPPCQSPPSVVNAFLRLLPRQHKAFRPAISRFLGSPQAIHRMRSAIPTGDCFSTGASTHPSTGGQPGRVGKAGVSLGASAGGRPGASARQGSGWARQHVGSGQVWRVSTGVIVS